MVEFQELVDKVNECWSNLGNWYVLADWLQSDGDKRGEYVVLDIELQQGKLKGNDKKRAEEQLSIGRKAVQELYKFDASELTKDILDNVGLEHAWMGAFPLLYPLNIFSKDNAYDNDQNDVIHYPSTIDMRPLVNLLLNSRDGTFTKLDATLSLKLVSLKEILPVYGEKLVSLGFLLALSRPANNDDILYLTCSPESANVRRLDLSRTAVSDRGLEMLAKDSFMNGLIYLSLKMASYITDDGVAALLTSPSMNSLRALDLSYTNTTDQALRPLVQKEIMPNLEKLDIYTCPHINNGYLLSHLRDNRPQLQIRYSFENMHFQL